MAALPLTVVHGALLLTWDLAGRIWITVGLLVAAAGALIWAISRLERVAGSPAAAVLIVATALRLLLLPLPPSLSDDVLRYVWDGRVVNAGHNPYLLAPEDPALEGLRDGLWSALPHRDVPTVYPPLALGIFSIAARFSTPVLVLKALLTSADLLTCVLLIRMAAALGLPVARVGWYAWNPLVTLEVAGMGHVDALGVVLLVAALSWVVVVPRVRSSAVTAAGALAAKLVPVVTVPILMRASARPLRFVLWFGAVGALLLLPMAAAGGVPPGLARYAVSWEFNGPLYEPLWRLSEGVDLRGSIEGSLDAAKDRWGRHDFWNRLYPYNYPQLHAKLILALALGAALVWIWRRDRPVAATGASFGALLLCSATVYPWYLLWVMPAAALLRHRAWLLLSLLLPLTYLPQHSPVELFPWIFVAVWLPFGVALALERRWSTA